MADFSSSLSESAALMVTAPTHSESSAKKEQTDDWSLSAVSGITHSGTEPRRLEQCIVTQVAGCTKVTPTGCSSSESLSELMSGLTQSEFVTYIIWAHETIRNSGVPNYMGCKITIPSKFRLEYIEQELMDYEDKEVIEFLKYGFPIGIVHHIEGRGPVPNHRSAVDHPSDMNAYVETEVNDRAVIGGFTVIPLKSPTFFSPLGSTEKRDSVDRRVIMDLSYPRGGVH